MSQSNSVLRAHRLSSLSTPQSIYTVAALQESGLKAEEAIAAFSFLVGWSVLDPVIDVRIAVAWLPTPAFATPTDFKATTTVVHGPVTVDPSRFGVVVGSLRSPSSVCTFFLGGVGFHWRMLCLSVQC